MNLEEIEALIDLINDTDITEIDVEEKEFKIKIKRGDQGMKDPLSYDHLNYNNNIQVPDEISKDDGDREANNDDGREEIAAPMVGTFYRAPAPDAVPFVKVGEIVNPGDTLCIIEAMKLMNEIEVETRGKIVEILVDDGEPVEYGEPLFMIEAI